MAQILRDHITSPGAWLGSDIQHDTSWILRVDDTDVAEIEAALRHAQSERHNAPLGPAEFPLDRFARKLDTIPELLEEGRGFILLRGLPRERYSDEQCELIYAGIAAHLGTPISQNKQGHLLGHVRDEGKSFDDPTVRGYQTRSQMDFHADQLPVDILGLFCLRTSKSGGASAVASVLAIHNILLDERPDLLEALYQQFTLDWRGEEPDGEQPWYTSPMLSYHEGKVTSRITSRQYFDSVTRHGDHLAITDIQREALEAVQDIANRPGIAMYMDFQEGDIQLLNNHTLLHARQEFEDYEDPRLKRHLLRMWISLPKMRRRKLADDLAERYRFVEMGGIPAKVGS